MIGGLTVTWYKSHRRDVAVVVQQNRRNGKIVPEKKLCIAWITKKKRHRLSHDIDTGIILRGKKLNISLKRHRNLQTKCQVTQEFEGSSVFQNIGCDQRPGNKFFWNMGLRCVKGRVLPDYSGGGGALWQHCGHWYIPCCLFSADSQGGEMTSAAVHASAVAEKRKIGSQIHTRMPMNIIMYNYFILNFQLFIKTTFWLPF